MRDSSTIAMGPSILSNGLPRATIQYSTATSVMRAQRSSQRRRAAVVVKKMSPGQHTGPPQAPDHYSSPIGFLASRAPTLDVDSKQPHTPVFEHATNPAHLAHLGPLLLYCMHVCASVHAATVSV